MAIRLIHTDTLLLESFDGNRIPQYAILSHTWEPGGEVSFQELAAINNDARDPSANKPGYRKIVETCQQARIQGISYAWLDSCCIDKTSSSELSEAINSMYKWYKNAKICYALLSDYDIGLSSSANTLANCRWFSRGWCLQELIAPRDLVFFDSKWNSIGSKIGLAALIASITRIDENVLLDNSLITTIPVARRMSWAARRETTREEDVAYCLLGIFDVNMPMLYGEGTKAFNRLQEEIIKKSNDLSIFAFPQSPDNQNAIPPPGSRPTFGNLFAISPADFLSCGELDHTKSGIQRNESFALTNRGLYFRRIKLVIDIHHGLYHLDLNCETAGSKPERMYLRKVGPSLYARCNQLFLPDSVQNIEQGNYKDNYPTKIEEDAYILTSISPSIQFRLEQADEYAICVLPRHHHLSRALQIVQRASSSDQWDIARMQFLTAGDRTTAAFWKIFPKLLGMKGNPQDTDQILSGPIYLACGLKHDDHASHPSPWLHLYSFEEWRRFEQTLGIVTDLNDLAGFERTGKTADRMILGRDSRNQMSIVANIQSVFQAGMRRFELELLLEEKTDY